MENKSNATDTLRFTLNSQKATPYSKLQRLGHYSHTPKGILKGIPALIILKLNHVPTLRSSRNPYLKPYTLSPEPMFKPYTLHPEPMFQLSGVYCKS